MKVDTLGKELAAVQAICEALVDLDDAGRGFVLKTVSMRLGISLALAAPQQVPDGSKKNISSPVETGLDPRSSRTPSSQTEREFFREKQPISQVHRVACLAFYLTHFKGQPQFKTKDLTKVNSDGGQPQMSNASVSIANAEKARLITPIGHGMKQITTLGEDVVKALPNLEDVKKLLSSRRRPRKRRALKPTAK